MQFYIVLSKWFQESLFYGFGIGVWGYDDGMVRKVMQINLDDVWGRPLLPVDFRTTWMTTVKSLVWHLHSVLGVFVAELSSQRLYV